MDEHRGEARWRSTRLDHLAADRSADPGDQAELALVFLAVSQRRSQTRQERVRVGPRAGVDSSELARGFRLATISTDAPRLDRAQQASRGSCLDPSIRSRPRPGARGSLSLTTRRFSPSPSSRIGPARVEHLLGPEHRQAARLHHEIQQRRHRRRLPDRGRDLFAADRSAVVERQGQRRRIVGIRDRELDRPVV